MSRLVSDCCGARPKSNGNNDSVDYGICSDCGEHCEYVDFDLPDNGTGIYVYAPDINEQRDLQLTNQKLK